MELSRRIPPLIFIILLCVHHAQSRFYGARSKRQNGAKMYLSASYIVPGGEGDDPYEWTDWSSPSECSRSCGGGVSYQMRECRRLAPSGAPLCSGGNRKYFSCNTQDCPEEETDFRAQQCSRFNHVPFDGIYYEWVPYMGSPNPCQLSCMPKGERFYYVHKAKVIDGTRCNDQSLDVCVDGQCQSVGCDMMLGSDAREDKCRKCGGDGSTCKTVGDKFTINNLSAGYNDILLIPTGATNIRVMETAPSNNYIACRNLSSHYYLNGNWRIDFPRPMFFAGAWWNYQRRPTGFAAPDQLTCHGPIIESIYIVMLVQDKNVSIDYEYSIPTTVSSSTPDVYTWTHMEYGQCSATCGGGTQWRVVTCNNRLNLEQVDPSLCDQEAKPTEAQECATDPCPPQWVSSDWSKCSKGCGSDGIQNRNVTCERSSSKGESIVEDDTICLDKVGNKPATQQECNRDVKNCPKYHLGPWSPCDKLCGEGAQKRKVTCFIEENGRKRVLSDDDCVEEKPETEKSCILAPCEGVDWIISEWSGCGDCGQTTETRFAICASKAGKVYPEEFCAPEVPLLSRPCESKKCQIQWFTSEWSKCSSACGKGVQSRTVLCGEYDGESITKVVDASQCDEATKPDSEQECEGEEKECPGQWFTGPWGPCSKQCGGGERQREVLCLANGTKSTNCDESKIESLSEKCNVHACTEDEVMPVDSTDKQLTDDEDEEEEEECDEDEEDEDEVEVVTGKMSEDLRISDGIDLDQEITTISSLITDELMLSDAPSDEPTPEDGSTLITPEGSGDEVDDSTLVTEGSGETDVTGSSVEVTTNTESSISSESTSLFSTESITRSSTLGSASTDLTSETSTTMSTFTAVSTDSTSEFSSDTSALPESGSTEVSGTTDLTSESSTEVSISTSRSSESSTDLASESSTEHSASTGGSSESSIDTSALTDSTSEESTTSESSTEFSKSFTDSTESTEASSESSTEYSLSTEASSHSSADSTETITDSSESTSESSTESTESTSESSTDSTESTSTDITSSTESTTQDSAESSTESSTADSTESSTESTESSTETPVSTESSVSTETSLSTESSVFTETSASTESSTSTDSSVFTESSAESTSESSTELSTESSTDSALSTESTSESSTETSIGTESTGSSSSTDIKTESSTEIFASTDSSLSTELTSEVSTDITASTTDSATEFSTSTETAETVTESSDLTESTDSLVSTVEISSTLSSASTESIDSSTISSYESTDSSETTVIDSTKSGSTVSSSKIYDFSTTDSTESEYTDSSTSAYKSTTVDIWSTEEEVQQSTPYTLETIVTKAVKPKKCKPKTCEKSPYGCCPDHKTKAKGPFDEGCPIPKTCDETEFGCCHDGVSGAEGKNFEGCPKSQCAETLFGCCPDKFTPADGEENEGCPEPTTLPPTTTTEMSTTEETASEEQATDITDSTSFEITETTDSAMPPYVPSCSFNEFGCCPDGQTNAIGENFAGCEKGDCRESIYGCCRDGRTLASGPNEEGCPQCTFEPYGCCPDNETPAHGPLGEGCCLASVYGCCPDNINSAHGPNFENCECQYSPYGCCPNNQTSARGPSYEGCSCESAKFGCCPDKLTAAKGPKFEGCACHTLQFGCCPDGITVAQGPHHYGCHCSQTEFKCCPDENTPAKGPDNEGCSCVESKFGCCPDGITSAQGEKFEECKNVKESPQKSCGLPKESGPCTNYTIKYFFDTSYGACARFWYGGCEGNGNRFESEDDCKQTCQDYIGKDACLLPKSSGPCTGYNKKWYFNADLDRCEEFNYGGCYGTNNRFDSREECQTLCAVSESLPPCEQPMDEGPCEGSFERWHYDNQTDTCRPFTYGGCKGNKNNYPTEHACNYHCRQPGIHKDYCSLPKQTGDCSAKQPRWYYSENDKKCMPFYYTGCGGNRNNFPSLQSCEDHCPKEVAKNVCEIAAEVGDCRNYEPMWYYDVNDERCRQFYYGGCGGNDNKFSTEDACKQRCEEPSQPETPLVAPQPEPEPQPERPPLLGEACEQNFEVGECTNYTLSWYYDYDQSICRQFYYGGCGGNDNRFETEIECQQRCILPPPDNSTEYSGEGSQESSKCFLPVASGNCLGYQMRWYYNSIDGVCEEFTYTECEGNANNFASEDECESECFAAQPTCSLPPVRGNCSDAMIRWHFEPQSGKCLEFEFSGCRPNRNNFKTEEECMVFCGERPPTPVYSVCDLPLEAGECDNQTTAWYYDGESMTCVAFTYTGCGGNGNRFQTREQCERQCGDFKGVGELAPPSPPVADNEVFIPCEEYEAECQTLRCPYGQRRVPVDNCHRCECVNPCAEYSCPEGQKCAIEIPAARSSQFLPVCRAITKPGECPLLTATGGSCSRECYDDADCRAHNKCCATGCSFVCVRPTPPTVPTTPSPPTATPAVIYPGEFAVKLEPKNKPELDVKTPVGGIAVLRCFATGNPAPNITWFFNNILIDTHHGRYVLTSTGDLTIVQVRQTDTGSYVCVAGNGLGDPLRREIELQVTEPVNMPAYVYGNKNATQIVTLNRPAVVRCPAGGHPAPMVYWWRNRERLPLVHQRYEFTRDYSLRFHSMQLSDLGPYTCHVWNRVSTRPASIKITLKAFGPARAISNDEAQYLQYIIDPAQAPTTQRPSYPYRPARPVAVPPPAVYEVPTRPPVRANAVIGMDPNNSYIPGSTITIGCAVQGYPKPNVTWIKDDLTIVPSERIQTTQSEPYRLIISDVNAGDSGKYGCKAANNVSYSISEETVTIESTIPLSNDCIDNAHFANCKLIVAGRYCKNKYYAKFCCRSCALAGQL